MKPMTFAEYDEKLTDKRLGKLPAPHAKELLRIGMSGGRNLVETVQPKARRDIVTSDLFDVQERLF